MINQSAIRAKLSTPTWGAAEPHTGLWLDTCILGQSREDHDSRKELIERAGNLPEAAAYRPFFARWEKSLQECRAQTRRAQVKGRMIVGLGRESVLETSICLHRTYGVPLIPGSALKGLAVSYAHQRLGGEWQQGGKFHTVVFGNTNEAGYITFFDALYVPGSGYKAQALYPDIITVHHEKYYQDATKAPSDSDDPNPVPFLSATGTYLLALAAPDFQQDTPHTRWIDLTFQILVEALEHYGIGAKTSSGYGRMAFPGALLKPLSSPVEVEHIRPNVPSFREGQQITGSVIAPTDDIQRVAPSDARAFLRYESFSTEVVLVVVIAEENLNWVPGNTRNCIFLRKEVRDGCTILICKPKPKK